MKPTRTIKSAIPRTVLYGPHGIGKSTFGAKSERPVFLPFEDGLSGISVDAYPLVTEWDQLMAAMTDLYTSAYGFKTLVIDSLDWAEDVILKKVCKDSKKNSIEDIPYGKGYVMALDLWRKWLSALDALRIEKGIVPLLLAHHEQKRYESPETESYDRLQLKLHRKAADLIQEWADIVAFVNYKVYTKSSSTGFGQTVAKAIGAGERVMYLAEKPAFVAKNRYGMPDEIPFNFETFQTTFTKHIGE